MNTTITTSTGAATRSGSRAIQLGLAALLGLAVIGVAGFAPMEVVHNAAHDYRHSMSFPCH